MNPADGAGIDNLMNEPLTLVVSLGLLGLLPFAFMTLTSFVKISTVLHITKSAIGAQSIPSSTVVMALSTALTLLVMAPVGSTIAERLEPALASEQSTGKLVQAVFEASAEPVRAFLDANASGREKQRFLLLANKADPKRAAGRAASDFPVVVPAFIISELAKAFALGFAIFLPFLVIDIVVGNVLMALGMQMMSPTQVSLPFKLLLFLMADGWGLLAQSLVSGYAPAEPGGGRAGRKKPGTGKLGRRGIDGVKACYSGHQDPCAVQVITAENPIEGRVEPHPGRG